MSQEWVQFKYGGLIEHPVKKIAFELRVGELHYLGILNQVVLGGIPTHSLVVKQGANEIAAFTGITTRRKYSDSMMGVFLFACLKGYGIVGASRLPRLDMTHRGVVHWAEYLTSCKDVFLADSAYHDARGLLETATSAKILSKFFD